MLDKSSLQPAVANWTLPFDSNCPSLGAFATNSRGQLLFSGTRTVWTAHGAQCASGVWVTDGSGGFLSFITLGAPYDYFVQGQMWVDASDALYVPWLDDSTYPLTGFVSVYPFPYTNHSNSANYTAQPPGAPLSVVGNNQGLLYFGDQFLASVSALSISSGSVVRTITNGLTLSPVGTDRANRIYAADAGSGCVAQFDSSGAFLRLIPSHRPASLISVGDPAPAVNPTGSVLVVVDYFFPTVYVWSVASGELLHNWTISAGDGSDFDYGRPNSIAVDEAQRVVMSRYGAEGVAVYLLFSIDGRPLNITYALPGDFDDDYQAVQVDPTRPFTSSS